MSAAQSGGIRLITNRGIRSNPQSHVICTPGAAAVIKTYSPNLMVHPLMRQSPSPQSSGESASSEPADKVASRIIDMLPRIHVLVIGPGLGRDPLMQDTVARVVEAARGSDTPVVLDADALQVVQKDPDLVRGWKLAVLTPNVVEFGRLCKALGIEEEVKKAAGKADGGGEEKKETARVEALARALGGVTIVQKGFHDFITDGETTLTVDLQGGKKRSGGQGDTLTGSIATFLGWRTAYLDGLWDHGGKLKEKELVQLAAFGGAAVTRVSLFAFSPAPSLDIRPREQKANRVSNYNRSAPGLLSIRRAAACRPAT